MMYDVIQVRITSAARGKSGTAARPTNLLRPVHTGDNLSPKTNYRQSYRPSRRKRRL